MFIRICIVFFLFNLAFFSLYGQENRALFVAIDNYPPNSGWAKIHATNDRNIIIPMLKKNGYKNENIKILLNENATKAAIIKGLNDLNKRSRKGDFIYIHFSCHGQQMADDNGDEPDGLDEALIPYDAKRRYAKGMYEGNNHLRDDELEYHLEKVRAKIGNTGNLTVVLDACHSGTGTRDEGEGVYVRGTAYVFAPDDYIQAEIDNGKLNLNLKKGKMLPPITVFSACRENEINYEYKDANGEYYGSLSYAFCKLVTSLQGLSNAGFSERLEKEMKMMFAGKRWKQTPFIESTDNNKIFSIGGQANK